MAEQVEEGLEEATQRWDQWEYIVGGLSPEIKKEYLRQKEWSVVIGWGRPAKVALREKLDSRRRARGQPGGRAGGKGRNSDGKLAPRPETREHSHWFAFQTANQFHNSPQNTKGLLYAALKGSFMCH